MIPIVTPEQMARIDAAAVDPTEVLVARAGAAVARAALDELGGAYGRRVIVIAGKGNNGWDGRVAAERLRARGVRCTVIDAKAADAIGADDPRWRCDLAIDAAYGTGFRGEYRSPIPTELPVLAVDIPSGVDGLTGCASGRPARAQRTVTFAALKPGLLYGDGPDLAGRVEVADIGLAVDSARRDVCVGAGAEATLVEDADVAAWLRPRSRFAHKWTAAVWVVGGSPGMSGAPALASRGAFAAGAGYVRCSTPGVEVPPTLPAAAVALGLPLVGWAADVADGGSRFAALVVGPGLGRAEATAQEVRELAATAALPVVLDGDALWAVADVSTPWRSGPRVITPHDGEFAILTGAAPGPDRIDAARRLAAERNAVVLLKGPTTTIADPPGRVAVVTSGDSRLATAGSGDVLSGMIGALLARGIEPFEAAAAAAYLHGRAGSLLPPIGGTADDLPANVSIVASALSADGAGAIR